MPVFGLRSAEQPLRVTGKIIVIDFMKKVNRKQRRFNRFFRQIVLYFFAGLILVVGSLIFYLNFAKKVEAIWWDDSWSYRKAITGVTN